MSYLGQYGNGAVYANPTEMEAIGRLGLSAYVEQLVKSRTLEILADQERAKQQQAALAAAAASVAANEAAANEAAADREIQDANKLLEALDEL